MQTFWCQAFQRRNGMRHVRHHRNVIFFVYFILRTLNLILKIEKLFVERTEQDVMKR
jgi:hypothetical protein